jgi:hypothetical protein
MRPTQVIRTLAASSATAICAAQTTAGAGNLLINGSTAVNVQTFNPAAGTASYVAIAQLDVQRNVAIASTGSFAGVTFTVSGTDQNGLPISEALAGPNNSTVTTVSNFFTVTQVAVSAAVGTSVTVGTGGTGASIPVVIDQYLTPQNTETAVLVSGTVNYTVQYTNNPILDCGLGGVGFNLMQNPATINWQSAAANLTGQTAYADNYLQAPATAVRLLTNSGTGTATLIVRQAGIM